MSACQQTTLHEKKKKLRHDEPLSMHGPVAAWVWGQGHCDSWTIKLGDSPGTKSCEQAKGLLMSEHVICRNPGREYFIIDITKIWWLWWCHATKPSGDASLMTTYSLGSSGPYRMKSCRTGWRHPMQPYKLQDGVKTAVNWQIDERITWCEQWARRSTTIIKLVSFI